LIGATNPAKAADGTIRKLYGTDVEKNAVHGSDSPEIGLRETAFFFSGSELGVSLDCRHSKILSPTLNSDGRSCRSLR
jgi:hypothetical protein